MLTVGLRLRPAEAALVERSQNNCCFIQWVKMTRCWHVCRKYNTFCLLFGQRAPVFPAFRGELALELSGNMCTCHWRFLWAKVYVFGCFASPDSKRISWTSEGKMNKMWFVQHYPSTPKWTQQLLTIFTYVIIIHFIITFVNRHTYAHRHVT